MDSATDDGGINRSGLSTAPGPQRLEPPLAYPLGVDAGVDNEMGRRDILRSEFARRRLRHRTQAELGTREGRVTGSAAQG